MSMGKICYEDHKIVYIVQCLQSAGPLAEGSLSISALLPSPKTPKAMAPLLLWPKGHSGAGAKRHQISGDQIYSTNTVLLFL